MRQQGIAAVGHGEPSAWPGLLARIALVLLLLTGRCWFVLPCANQWPTARRTA